MGLKDKLKRALDKEHNKIGIKLKKARTKEETLDVTKEDNKLQDRILRVTWPEIWKIMKKKKNS